jgi:tetratricopeptide (TPR) repeat protein
MALTVAAGSGGSASAVSFEQAREKCREQVTPEVRACVRSKMMANQDRDIEKYLPGCRATVTDKMKACIGKLIGATGLKQQEETKPAKNVAVTINRARTQTAPPRTIADITAILDQEKPDPARAKRMQAAADAEEPAKADAVARAHFYHNRALARSDLGRYAEAGADAKRAMEFASGKVADVVLNNFRQTAALQYIYAGEPKLALGIYLKMAEETEKSSGKGFLFTAYRLITNLYLQLGDLERAQAYLQKIETAWKGASSIRGYADHGPNWRASVDDAKGKVLEARGHLAESLAAFEAAESARRGNIDKSARAMVAVPRAHLEQAADLQLLAIARVKAKLGRLVEAETDARRALLNRLRATGKYAPATARYIAALGMLMVEQGRYGDAKKLIATTVDIFREVGVPEDTQTFVGVMSNLASVQALAGEWTQAAESYDVIRRAVEKWEPGRRGPFLTNLSRVETLYRTGRVEDGLRVSRRLLEFREQRYGPQNSETALARGFHAAGLALAKRDEEALKEFRAAVPLLTETTFKTDNDDALNAAARDRSTQAVVESYIALLERLGAGAGPDVATDTFRLADAIRGRSVQKALTAASARMTASDPKLAEAVRKEQDLRQQIGTQLGQLNALLASPPSERDEAGVATLRKEIEKTRAEHQKVRADIDRRYPDYADLIDPKPPSVAQIKQMLKPGEALLSFYFGRDASLCGRSRTAASWSSPQSATAPPRSRARSRSCAKRWSRRRR